MYLGRKQCVCASAQSMDSISLRMRSCTSRKPPPWGFTCLGLRVCASTALSIFVLSCEGLLGTDPGISTPELPFRGLADDDVCARITVRLSCYRNLELLPRHVQPPQEERAELHEHRERLLRLRDGQRDWGRLDDGRGDLGHRAALACAGRRRGGSDGVREVPGAHKRVTRNTARIHPHALRDTRQSAKEATPAHLFLA